MIIGLKDAFRPIAIAVVACCAVFVCTLFLNYNIDLAAVDASLLDEAGKIFYEASKSQGKIVAAVTGGCLVATSVVLLVFYIKNYIDAHGKELGILKALGYSNLSVSAKFWIFGLSVLVGCAVGFGAAFAYLPRFYDVSNDGGLLPDLDVRFHVSIPLCLVLAPTAVFTALSVLFAFLRLKAPALELMRGQRELSIRHIKNNEKNDRNDEVFLRTLRRTTLRSKKMPVFFVTFSAFCFSAMVQMSISMIDLSNATFAVMILVIGLILAFMTLVLSLANVVKGNEKTIAMMRIIGYDYGACSSGVIGVYRPFSYIGFVVGTLYQYGLLKIMMTFIYDDMQGVPEYGFDWKALLICAAAFVVIYELIIFLFSRRIRKLPIKSVMIE